MSHGCGAGYGASAPYSFAWNSSIGEIEGADAPTALLRTESVAAGTYDVLLTIIDVNGALASDTVKVVVTAAGSAADPHPVVDAGGPYCFEPGQF